LIAQSDVLIENFRPGVMQRFGLGYEAARLLRPEIVYCSVSGYGQSGPMRDWPAIDNSVQATSGMMNLSGEPGDPPIRVGFPIIDTLTGQTAAFAILAALVRRLRGGGGEYIDVAMLDASLAFMTSAVVPYLVTGRALARTGNTGYSGQPTSAMFPARDGRLISIGVVQQNQFVALARLLGREDWLADPRYRDSEQRRQNAPALQAELAGELGREDAAEWERIMCTAGIPCGMVREIGEAASLPHLQARGAKLSLTVTGIPGDGRVEIPNAGFSTDADGPSVAAPPPRLDEHGEEIRRWLAGQGSAA
jgi:crotonobetainyl-CoA:carnitine CoA-transferase CaiB-like acyl-CoA transferase